MTPQDIGGWVGSGILIITAAIQTIRVGIAKKQAATNASSLTTSAQTDLAKSNADLAEAYKRQAEEWKTLSEKIQKELHDYRNWVHEKDQQSSKTILALTEENARLRSQTDLTPLLEHMKRYDANAERMANTLSDLIELIREMRNAIRTEQT